MQYAVELVVMIGIGGLVKKEKRSGWMPEESIGQEKTNV